MSARTTTSVEYAIENSAGLFRCKDLTHARGMMKTTSPVLGTPSSRKIVTRQVIATDWEPVLDEDLNPNPEESPR